ncbi:PDZ domain-containing protein [Streptomyces griseoviridis]
MEQTALRPRPMPGRDPGGHRGRRRGQEPDHGPAAGRGQGPGGAAGRGSGTAPPAARPRAGRRRARRLRTALFGLCVGAVLLLAGVGLGTVGVTLLGGAGHAAPRPGPPPRPAGTAGAAAAGAPVTLGVQVVDTERPGALIVAVHVPGPGFTAGLVRGDVVVAFGAGRVAGTADLARAVTGARPGTRVTLTVRHRSGAQQRVTVVPGVVV